MMSPCRGEGGEERRRMRKHGSSYVKRTTRIQGNKKKGKESQDLGLSKIAASHIIDRTNRKRFCLESQFVMQFWFYAAVMDHCRQRSVAISHRIRRSNRIERREEKEDTSRDPENKSSNNEIEGVAVYVNPLLTVYHPPTTASSRVHESTTRFNATKMLWFNLFLRR